MDNCPACGVRGKPVRAVTLRALVRDEHQGRIGPGRYRFCATQGCDVVYFAEDGSGLIDRAALKVRVGVKESEPPRPVCYCFGHTVEEIVEEVRRCGRSLVLDDIRGRVEREGCHCEERNPQGSCCLGTITRIVEEACSPFGFARR